jgi:PAS domain S-box-containing protein
MTSDYYYVVSIGETWRTEWVGGAFEQITGFTVQDVRSFDDWKLQIHPDDLPVIQRAMDDVLAGRPAVFEYRISTKEGQARWLRDHARPVLDEAQGPIRSIFGAVQDITERKQAQGALQRSEERYALAQRAANIGSWDWDIQSGALHWSERIEPMFGFEPGGFGATYEAFLACVHPNDRQHVIDAVDDCIERKNDYTIEHRIIWPNGEIRWVLETGDVVRDENGVATRMLGVVQDITGRKEAEEALEWQVTVNAVIAELSSSLLLTTSIEEISGSVLDSAMELTSSQSGYVGYLQPQSGDFEVSALIQKASLVDQGRESHLGPTELRGLSAWVLNNRVPLLSNAAARDPRWPAAGREEAAIDRFLAVPALIGDRLVGQIALVDAERDYTERHLALVQRLADIYAIALQRHWAEEALKQRTIELETRNDELDAFAHTVAHDLRNPLGIIAGFAQVLESDHATMPTEDLEKSVRIIAHHSHKLSKIVEDLLLLAQIRKVDVELGPLDMAEIVAEARWQLAALVTEHQAEIALPEAWPQALGHPTWVEQVWINYLSNAIKYGGRPPRIRLGAERQPNGMVHFWVRDNGPGLSPQEQARLFAPFSQLGGARTKGHGLGLSIVRRIVEKLGGQVGVHSQGLPGQGSTFTFSLPAAPDD